MYGGWHQVGFSRELEGTLTPARIGARRLVLVRRGERLQAFDAVCPHRGAHLGYGGQLDGEVIVCPFHGRRIGLGDDAAAPYRVRGYPTLELGGLVFVLTSQAREHGFTAFLERLAATHCFVPGFSLKAPVGPEWIVENVFDTDHFHAVHKIDRRPELEARPADGGGLSVEAVFETSGANPWQEGFGTDGPVRTRFFANVFSPTLCATELGDPDRPQVVVTAATPRPDGGCDIRVSAIVPLASDGAPPPDELVLALLRDSRRAFEQDMEIWTHMDTEAPANLAAGDRPIVEYRRFCDRCRIA